jgi:electron transfer flavoprotein alpha subunit
MDKYIKRLQTRAFRKGISVSKSQVREVYQSVVATPESPSEEEMSAVIEALETQYQAPAYEADNNQLATTEQALQPTEETQEMIQSIPSQETPKGDLATSSRSDLSLPPEGAMSLTQQQIKEAVEMQFGRENVETKTAILNYIAQDTFATATELQQALSKLRQMRLDILLKLISDHNQQSSGDDNLIKVALLQASTARQQETSDFFASFDKRLTEMRASFGV